MTEPKVKRPRDKTTRRGDGWLAPRGNVWIACMKHRRPGETKTTLHRKATPFFVDRDEKQKAQEYLRQWSAKIRAGSIAPSGPPPATIKDLREEYLRDVRLNRPGYEVRAGQCFKRLVEHFGGKKVAAEIDGDALTAYVEARLKTKKGKAKASAKPKSKDGEEQEPHMIAPATVNRELAALRRAFRLFRTKEASRMQKRLTAWPEIVLLTEDNVRERCPADEELEKVVAELPHRLKAPIRFAALTGLRIANVLGLQWAWVHERERTIRIPALATKGGKRAKRKRAITIPYGGDPELAAILRERREATDAYERERAIGGVNPAVPHVFWHEGKDAHGRTVAVPTREYQRAWIGACKRAGAEGLHVHDLRRYFAVRAVRAGVDEVTVMALAGWSTRAMFDRYSVRNEDDRAAAVAKMARARAAERRLNEDGAAQAKEA